MRTCSCLPADARAGVSVSCYLRPFESLFTAVAWPLHGRCMAVAWPVYSRCRALTSLTWLCAGAAGRGGDAAGSAATNNDASAAALQSSSNASRRVIPQPARDYGAAPLYRPGPWRSLARAVSGVTPRPLPTGSRGPFKRATAPSRCTRSARRSADRWRAPWPRTCVARARVRHDTHARRACLRWSVCLRVCVRGRLRRQLRCGRRSSGYRSVA
jgi:hypothetical protein